MAESRLLRRLRPRLNELERTPDNSWYIHDNAFNMDEGSGCSVTMQDGSNLSSEWLHLYWCNLDCRLPSGDALAVCYVTLEQAEKVGVIITQTSSIKCFPDLHFEISYDIEDMKKKLGVYARLNGLLKLPMKSKVIEKSGCCD